MKPVISKLRKLALGFNPPCSNEQLAEAENLLACKLPKEITLLFRDHDGTQTKGPLVFRLMPIKEVIVLHQQLSDRQNELGMLRKATRLFWTNDDSDFAAAYVEGPLKGKVCFVSHDEPDFSPVFRSVASFYNAMLSKGSAAQDFMELPTDYPLTGDSAKASGGETALLDQLLRLFGLEGAKERKELAFQAMAVLPKNENDLLFRFAESDDMWIQEKACELLGKRGVQKAIPLLVKIATQGQHNGKLAAITALGKIGTLECRKGLLQLTETAPPGWGIYLANALKDCGGEATHDKGVWRYREPESDTWIQLR